MFADAAPLPETFTETWTRYCTTNVKAAPIRYGSRTFMRNPTSAFRGPVTDVVLPGYRVIFRQGNVQSLL